MEVCHSTVTYVPLFMRIRIVRSLCAALVRSIEGRSMNNAMVEALPTLPTIKPINRKVQIAPKARDRMSSFMSAIIRLFQAGPFVCRFPAWSILSHRPC